MTQDTPALLLYHSILTGTTIMICYDKAAYIMVLKWKGNKLLFTFLIDNKY